MKLESETNTIISLFCHTFYFTTLFGCIDPDLAI